MATSQTQGGALRARLALRPSLELLASWGALQAPGGAGEGEGPPARAREAPRRPARPSELCKQDKVTPKAARSELLDSVEKEG